jgi:hypothetical protein
MEGIELPISGDRYVSFCRGVAVCSELISVSVQGDLLLVMGTSAVVQMLQSVLN